MSGIRPPFLLALSAGLALLSSRAAEIVTVPITLTLDPPAAAAPGANHLRISLDGGIIGSDADSSKLTGTVDVIMQINVDDPDNPVVVGQQFVSGDVAFENTSFTLFTLFISNVTVNGTGVGANIVTPSAQPEPVTANSFDATLHSIDINRGTLTATGTVLGQPVNETQDLSASPLSGPASGTGGTSIVKLPSTPIAFTYQVGVSLPVSFVAPIPVNPSVTITATVTGSVVAKGQTTVIVLPRLRPIAKTTSGLDLEVTGKVGATVLLRASEDLVGWGTIATLTLTSPTSVVTDPGALNLPRRFYRFEQP